MGGPATLVSYFQEKISNLTNNQNQLELSRNKILKFNKRGRVSNKTELMQKNPKINQREGGCLNLFSCNEFGSNISNSNGGK